MSTVGEQQVLDALRQVRDSERGGDIVSLGMVSGLAVRDGHVAFALEVEPARAERLEPLRKAAEQAVRRLPGGLSGRAVLTAPKAAPTAARGAPHAQHGAPPAKTRGPAG